MSQRKAIRDAQESINLLSVVVKTLCSTLVAKGVFTEEEMSAQLTAAALEYDKEFMTEKLTSSSLEYDSQHSSLKIVEPEEGSTK